MSAVHPVSSKRARDDEESVLSSGDDIAPIKTSISRKKRKSQDQYQRQQHIVSDDDITPTKSSISRSENNNSPMSPKKKSRSKAKRHILQENDVRLDRTRQQTEQDMIDAPVVDVYDEPQSHSSNAHLTDAEKYRENLRILHDLDHPVDDASYITSDRAILVVEAFEGMWVTEDHDPMSVFDMVKRNLDLSDECSPDGLVDPSIVDIKAGFIKNRMISLYVVMMRGRIVLNTEFHRSAEFMDRFNALGELQHYAISSYHAMMCTRYKMRYPEKTLSSANHLGFTRYMSRDKVTEYPNSAKLALALLDDLSKKQYRKSGSDIYKPKYTKDGYFTNYWEKHCSIHEYVSSFVDLNKDIELFVCLGGSSKVGEGAEKFLMWYNTPYFPEVIQNRYYMSFSNGVYCLGDDEFFPYVDPRTGKSPVDIVDHITGKITKRTVDPSIVSCSYTDRPFDLFIDPSTGEKMPAHKIPNPILDGILKKQNLHHRVMAWWYILNGRMFYEIGEHDNWQVAPLVLGFAGTGKSTLLKHSRKCYKLENVGILANNVERQWALSSIYNKYVIYGYEVKQNFNWEQSEFQSCISGEEVSVAEKHKTAFAHLWNVPIILAGNEMIKSWTDNSGSLARRLLIFYFDQLVSKMDTNTGLMDELDAERPAFIVKANRFYRDMALEPENQGKDIWALIPKYFHKISEEMMKTSHPLINFMSQKDKVELGGNKLCKFDVFKATFNAWFKENNTNKHPNVSWDRDFYSAIFSQHGIKMVCGQKTDTEGKVIKGRWLEGIDITRGEEHVTDPSENAPPSKKSKTSL